MSFKTDQVILLGFLDEGVFQFFRGQAEWNVHNRACRRGRMTAIKATASIDRCIDSICFLAVGFLDFCETTQFLRPLEYQSYNVDGKSRGGVVQGSTGGQCF